MSTTLKNIGNGERGTGSGNAWQDANRAYDRFLESRGPHYLPVAINGFDHWRAGYLAAQVIPHCTAIVAFQEYVALTTNPRALTAFTDFADGFHYCRNS